ncbi:TPA: hypothetical protein ACH3X2_004918 [Trebouxia sp. C0005]
MLSESEMLIDPLRNGSVDVITWDLLLPGAAKITSSLPSFEFPLLAPGTCRADGAELSIYLNPETFCKVAGEFWRTIGFRHPITKEIAYKEQVTLLWPSDQRYCRAAHHIEAKYIQYKANKRHKLVALKQTLDKRAVYDDNSAANLLNAAKYSAVGDLLWPFIVPAQDSPSSIAGKALLYAKKLWHHWTFNGWVGIQVSDAMSGFYLPWSCAYPPELVWLMEHAAAIDRYAADGTHPARNLFVHVTRWDLMYYGGLATDISVSRNLNRLLDAVTCFAYWNTIRQHELAGALILRNRLNAAVAGGTTTRDILGSMARLPPELLQVIAGQLE